MKTKIKMTNLDSIDGRTKAAHYAGPGGNWLHSQVWSWDGGDAIVSPANNYREAYFTIRLGDKIHHTMGRGIAKELACFGIETETH